MASSPPWQRGGKTCASPADQGRLRGIVWWCEYAAPLIWVHSQKTYTYFINKWGVKDMKANETKVDKFLATNETTFAIPVYQRNYDWTLFQCKQLLHDIIDVGGNDKTNAHFIGSIVYVHDDVYTASGLTELTIIDGQQRLTTITLIYIALFRLAKELDNQMLVSRIQKTYLINEFAPEEEKLKLKQAA